jgi:hypothetical protein
MTWPAQAMPDRGSAGTDGTSGMPFADRCGAALMTEYPGDLTVEANVHESRQRSTGELTSRRHRPSAGDPGGEQRRVSSSPHRGLPVTPTRPGIDRHQAPSRGMRHPPDSLRAKSNAASVAEKNAKARPLPISFA